MTLIEDYSALYTKRKNLPCSSWQRISSHTHHNGAHDCAMKSHRDASASTPNDISRTISARTYREFGVRADALSRSKISDEGSPAELLRVRG
jgi:hypothetical protein